MGRGDLVPIKEDSAITEVAGKKKRA